MLFVFSIGLIPLSLTFSSYHLFVLVFSATTRPLLYSASLSASLHPLSFPFLHLYSFSLFPLLLLLVLGNVHQAYWHMTVVHEICHDFTHAHTHTHARVRACKHRPVGDGG